MISISCQGILFDLDGTLVDSWKCVEYAWQSWCFEHGLPYNDLVERFNGTRAIDIVKTLKPELDPEQELAKLNNLELSQAKNISLIPGALEIIKLIPKNKWGIVTSGTQEVAHHKLNYAKIDLPNVLITAEKITQGKPHPQGYLKAASMLNIDPKQCLVFEDAPQGLKAARTAGMKVIALSTTFPASALSEADACIDNYNCINISLDNSQIDISITRA